MLFFEDIAEDKKFETCCMLWIIFALPEAQ